VRTTLLLLELGIIVIVLAVLARLAASVGFSPIPLYLLAGLLIGEGGLLPVVTAEPFIEAGAEIGVILLLFMLGLDYTAEELVSSLRSSARSGLLDLALNFTPGFAAGFLLGWGLLPALFLGGITYISSSGVVAKLLDDLEWVGNREAPTVLSILVVEDLIMALYLPLVAVLARGESPAVAALSVAVAMVAAVSILFLALRFGPLLSRILFSRSDEAVLLGIFGSVLVVAGLTEALRISAAVGAFLVGIAVSGPSADRARTLLTPLRDLFGAVFFVFFGLRIDPSSIPPVAAVVAVLALVTVPTKVATGWWSAAQAGVGPRGRLRAGAALVARGEFSIAIAALAVASGVEPRLGAVAAGYVLVMAVLGPLLARGTELVPGLTRARSRG
jgi:monovalent cation:H+ antiporter-2, CPA2 family